MQQGKSIFAAQKRTVVQKSSIKIAAIYYEDKT